MATDFEPGKIPAGGPTAAIWGNGDLKGAFDPLTVDPSYDAARQFEQAANLWAQGVDTFARSITRSISEAWEGASAEAAKTAIQNYTQKAHDLTPLLEQLTDHMADSATAVVNTKKAIPDTVVVTWTSWAWPPHRFDLEDRQGNARQEAWEAYTTNYVNPLGDIDTTIPVLPRADDAANPSDMPAPGSSGPGPSGPAPSSPGTPGDPNSPTTPGTPGQPNTAQPSTPSDTQSPSTTTAGTTPDPSTTAPGRPVAPSSVTPSGLTTGSPDFPGGPNLPGGPSGTIPGGPGTSVPGSTTTGTTANQAAARLATGAAGMAGLPGMGAAGRKDSEEDGEHTTPDYLITAENTHELLGDIPPTIPGGVIGARPRD